MRAIWEEMRRAIRLTFNEEVRQAFRERRSHPGWLTDPYLRKGFFWAIPVFVVGMAVVLGLFGSAIRHSVVLFYAYALPVALLANLIWLGVAAYLRAKATGP